MNGSTWKRETLWVARNEHSIIIRVSETSPESWTEKPEPIDHGAITIQRLQEENRSLMQLIQDVSELISWRDRGNGKEEAFKMIMQWVMANYPPKRDEVKRNEN